MAQVRMKKVFIISHKSYLEKVLSSIQQLGVLDISSIKKRLAETDWAVLIKPHLVETKEIDALISNLKHGIEFFLSFEKRKRSIVENFVEIKRLVPLDSKKRLSLAKKAIKNMEGLVGEYGKYDGLFSEIKAERNRLLELRKQLERLLFSVPLEEINDTEKTTVLIGKVRKGNVSQLKKARIAIEKVGGDKKSITCIVAFEKGDEDASNALKKSGFSKIEIPPLLDYTGTPEEIIKQIDGKLGELGKREEKLKKEAKGFIKEWKVPFFCAYDTLKVERDMKAASPMVGESASSFLIEGWVKEEDGPELRKVVEKATGRMCEISVRDPREGEKPPIVLRNNPLIAPFEVVTRTFGMPNYGEIDPTPFLAPFFFIFTGTCLTDAGYGIMLTLMALYMRHAVPTLKQFFTLIAYIGVATTIIGALIGGWFGIQEDNPLYIAPLIFNSMKDPLTFLILAMGMGITQVLAGIGVGMYKNIRDGKIADALMDQGLWILLILSFIAFALVGAAVIPASLVPAGAEQVITGVIVLSIVCLVLTQGRKEKSMAKKLLYGTVSLYGLMGYLSDVLSYARLLALGMATGVIALIINTLAGLAMGIPVIGIIICAIILIVGHPFNMILNLLGSYIHSSRLQYIEFFSKFFEGGGRRFKPFKVAPEYVSI